MEFFEMLKKVSPTAVENEDMKKHTSFKIGGAADYMAFPENAEEIKGIIELCKEKRIPYVIIGNGSNLLVSDKGIEGVVIKIASGMADMKVEGDVIRAGAGVLLSTLSKKALEHSLTGLEFASGIPGTLGGAVVMNAGAYGGEMKDVLEKIGYIDAEGNICEMVNENASMGYRTSIFSDSELIVLYCTLRLKKGDKNEISDTMNELNAKRREKQPLNLPSAGSTFKRPQGYFAAKLIEDAGLKGFTLGGAAVSEKHSGFVVNVNDATAEDVKALMSHVKKTVYEKFGVALEPEVKFLGRM